LDSWSKGTVHDAAKKEEKEEAPLVLGGDTVFASTVNGAAGLPRPWFVPDHLRAQLRHKPEALL